MKSPKNKHPELNKKWWHRLAKVFYILSVLFLVFWAGAAAVSSIPSTTKYMDVTENFKVYIYRTTPNFKELGEEEREITLREEVEAYIAEYNDDYVLGCMFGGEYIRPHNESEFRRYEGCDGEEIVYYRSGYKYAAYHFGHNTQIKLLIH